VDSKHRGDCASLAILVVQVCLWLDSCDPPKCAHHYVEDPLLQRAAIIRLLSSMAAISVEGLSCCAIADAAQEDRLVPHDLERHLRVSYLVAALSAEIANLVRKRTAALTGSKKLSPRECKRLDELLSSAAQILASRPSACASTWNSGAGPPRHRLG
jgi:hypothetical protein